MNEPSQVRAHVSADLLPAVQARQRHYEMPWRKFAMALALLTLLYLNPLFSLFQFACASSLYSHTLLIPFVSGYFFWLRKGSPGGPPTRQLIAILPLFIGVSLLAAYWSGSHAGAGGLAEGRIGILVMSYLLLLYSTTIAILGWNGFARFQFPLLFLIFLIPFPSWLLNWLETGLQHASAYVAHGLFSLSGMPVLRDATAFQLPGIRMLVAPECSGIHSSLVLFITSVVAGQLFLKSSSFRLVLTLAVIPLGVLRNAFRVFTIGQLCVHYGPQMFDSYIHRRGGPIFFGLSLIPFFLLLLWLAKVERGRRATAELGRKESP